MNARKPILVTGSMGLIGTAVTAALRRAGWAVIGIDGRLGGDVTAWLTPGDGELGGLLRGAAGVVHLAGVSRVVFGQRDPAACWRNNVDLSAAIVAAVAATPQQPWLIQASSREVLGQSARLPADDATPIAPVNVYGASKAAAETLVRQAGIRAAIVRFSNVYGGVNDHVDRVIPAFVAAARAGAVLRVDGAEVMIDPVHVDDVAVMLVALASRLEAGKAPDGPLLLAHGSGITLIDLARRVCALTGSSSRIEVAAARDYDVARFFGTSARAAAWGWRPAISIDAGLARM